MTHWKHLTLHFVSYVNYTFYFCTRNKKMKQELIYKIGVILQTYGLKSTTMDDIASHLKISKKTLYKHFKDKVDIVNKVMEVRCQVDTVKISEITLVSKNAIEEIIKINNLVSKDLSNSNPAVLFDLKKHYPEAHQYLRHHKESFITALIEKNLERGIEEGMYRSNIDTFLVSRFYKHIIENLWDQEIFKTGDYSFSQIHSEMSRYHIRGIASEKGHNYLNELISSGEFTLI